MAGQKEKKQNVRRMSIRWQFSLIFIGLMIGAGVLCVLINTLFLSSYYTSEKTKILVRGYDAIVRASENEDYQSQEFIEVLDEISKNSYIEIIIMDSDSRILYTSIFIDQELDFRLIGYILGLGVEDTKDARVLAENEDYVIRRIGRQDNESLELYGRLDNGVSFILRTPIESIKESATYANRFFIYVMLVTTVLGSIVIAITTKRITNPIKQLNTISEEMVELNFDARYAGKDRNEIGLLGNNMNRLSNSLKTAIGELKAANIELQKDIEKKEQIDEMRKEFLSNVSHELKTPIALIQGYAEGLKDGITDDPESMAFYCDVIMDEASKMNDMVRKLLTLNQLEFGNDTPNMERFDLRTMISNYLATASLLAEQEGISVRFTQEESVWVWGDEFKAETVLTNYFSNAVHHCMGDVLGERYIEIRIDDVGSCVRVSVKNTGERIPEESLSRLWEKFYKVDKARTREYGGSGVGLSIVKATQESMGQQYGVENVENGVIFWFDVSK